MDKVRDQGVINGSEFHKPMKMERPSSASSGRPSNLDVRQNSNFSQQNSLYFICIIYSL